MGSYPNLKKLDFRRNPLRCDVLRPPNVKIVSQCDVPVTKSRPAITTLSLSTATKPLSLGGGDGRERVLVILLPSVFVLFFILLCVVYFHRRRYRSYNLPPMNTPLDNLSDFSTSDSDSTLYVNETVLQFMFIMLSFDVLFLAKALNMYPSLLTVLLRQERTCSNES